MGLNSDFQKLYVDGLVMLYELDASKLGAGILRFHSHISFEDWGRIYYFSGKARTPVIADDTAASKIFARLLYGMSEGEIEGLADGLKSVFLDETALEDENGNKNFEGVKFDFRNGANDQEYIAGFEDISSETAVGVELKSSSPWIKGITNVQLDAVVVRLRWGALRKQNPDNGDVSGIKIEYAIDVQTGGGVWETMLETNVTDKTSANYERTHWIGLLRNSCA